MTTTSDSTPATTAWVEVASGAANVSVFRENVGLLYVYVGPTIPGAGTFKGAILAGDERQFVASGLGASDKVFVRAATTSSFTVMKS